MEWLNANSFSIINTHMAPNGLHTLLDLSISSSTLLPWLDFHIEDVSFGSDHFPVCLDQDNPRKDYFSSKFLCWPDICWEVNPAFSTLYHLNYNFFHDIVSCAMSYNSCTCEPLCPPAPAW